MSSNQWTQKKLFLFSILVVGAVLLLIEGGFRIWFYMQTKGMQTSLAIQGSSLQMEDEKLIFRNRPFYLDFQQKFQHNEEGMRVAPGDVRMPVKTEQDYWVFLFGASAMEGMGSNKDGEWMDITGQADYPWNETIAYYLQTYLQEMLPGKKVRVFNAANTSYTIEQSLERYKELSATYQMDFVISMDGQNEPPVLGANETAFDFLRKDWSHRPTGKFPLSWIIPLTRHSAFAYQIKQQAYHRKARQRASRNESEGFPRKQFWLQQPAGRLQTTTADDSTQRAIKAYVESLQQFRRLLLEKKQKGRLILQQHLIFRHMEKADATEKDLWNYYCSAYNHPRTNTFLQMQRAAWAKEGFDNDSLLLNLSLYDSSSIPVFTDYCHLTTEMNKAVARQLAERIVRR